MTVAISGLSCPRCQATRLLAAIGDGTLARCAGCEWQLALSAQSPAGTATAALAAGGTAITVASGGASFTAGMLLLADTAAAAEVLTVTGTPSATSVPVSAAARDHASGFTFGQLAIAPAYPGVQAVPAAPGWGS